MEALHQQLAGADAELEELRTAAAQLKQGVEAKCEHIAELEADVSKTREEAVALRQQIESNEKAVGQLQDKLSSRETELTSLRAHFDREAADLKKRADQEMWIVRRRLRRLQKGALLGGAVAACFLAVLVYYAIGGSREDARPREKPGRGREPFAPERRGGEPGPDAACAAARARQPCPGAGARQPPNAAKPIVLERAES